MAWTHTWFKSLGPTSHKHCDITCWQAFIQNSRDQGTLENQLRASRDSSGISNATHAECAQHIPHIKTTSAFASHVQFHRAHTVGCSTVQLSYIISYIHVAWQVLLQEEFVGRKSREISKSQFKSGLQQGSITSSNKVEIIRWVRTKLPVSEQHFPGAPVPRGFISTGTRKNTWS